MYWKGMVFYCFPFTILLGMNCRVSCVISQFITHLNSDIICDYYSTKLFTFLLIFGISQQQILFANLQRLEIYCQYIRAGCTRSVLLGRCILKRFPAVVIRCTSKIVHPNWMLKPISLPLYLSPSEKLIRA